MALPKGQYRAQNRIGVVQGHHASFQELWESRWKGLASTNQYPFLYAAVQDFSPIVEELIQLGMKEPFDWEVYAEVFRPHSEMLLNVAAEAERSGENEKASEYYLRACAVSYIARFPLLFCDGQRNAWETCKKACLKGLALRGTPIHEVLIPHRHAAEGETNVIPAYVVLPEGATKENPAPVVISIAGLDCWRTEMVAFADVFRENGVGFVAVEIPGTGDCPADPKDPLSPDRLWSSVLDWLDAHGGVDSRKIMAWGISTGGYYAIRIAHTHSTRLLGVVSHGGACHHMFDPEWLNNINTGEYPFHAADSFAHKWGFGNDTERCKNEAGSIFSLLRDGTLDKPSTRLLLGEDDTIFPIDDFYLCLLHGSPKEVRIFSGEPHMGGKLAIPTVLDWMFKLCGKQVDMKASLARANFKPMH